VPTVRIEHRIHDYAAWRAAFDRDPVNRKQSGVRRYRLFRPVDDPNYILIDLDFDSAGEADAFIAAMRKVWQSPQAAPALLGSPQVRITEEVETTEL
jgi:hypothetical protein